MRAAAMLAFERALLEDDPEALYEQAPCGYLSVLPDGRVAKANRTFLTWLGDDEDRGVTGHPFTDLLTAGSRLFHETHYQPLLHGQGTVKEIALDLVRTDGSVLPVLVNAVLERSTDGAPHVTRVAVFDATERRHYEQELLAAKRRAEKSERHSAELARTLQETLMPPRSPRIEGMDVATAYRPAGDGHEIGGDFHDVFQLADRDWVVTLGDVSGKGVGAAVVATLARHSIRALAVSEGSPAEILRQLNQVLIHHPTERFCTTVVLRLRHVDGHWQVTMANGGHPPAVLLERSHPPRPVDEPTCLVGAFDDAVYEDVRIDLGPRSTLLLYTDGVTEARGPEGFYGEGRLMQLLAGASGDVGTLVARVLDDVLRFQGGVPRDDIAMIALHPSTG
ncbi:PP2C family protein-serine/threonine phosphatase [uncultured Phycicoccus sp.]|uniref:PP2C family protein-serine/threonine phosphatase n=1 Tax=uncultured Phycicoccus sp. TaxID=661422 RepID=UPI0026046739|nr:SpoIIE family protein phosphatase [uncultured Phycicoccus sp.]